MCQEGAAMITAKKSPLSGGQNSNVSCLSLILDTLPVVRWKAPVVNLLSLCFWLNPVVSMENQGCFVCAREGASMAGAKKMPVLRRAK